MGKLVRRLRISAIRTLKLVDIYLRRRHLGMARYARMQQRGLPLQERTVLFEAYRATKIADNPYAIFKAMVDDPSYRDFTFVWAIDDESSPYRRELASRANVRFCKIHSRAYVRALSTAKYLVNNKAWPGYFSKRPGQVYVTTWHATAFKMLGKDQGGTMGQLRNFGRNLLHADWLVMPNRFTSDVILRSNDVDGVFPGYVLESGYPRIDLTLATPRERVEELLQRHCGADTSKKIVLYAPTWRGETGEYIDSTEATIEQYRKVRLYLPDEYELLLKVHDLTYGHLAARRDVDDVLYVPDWIDTNELLAAVDVLVTDYSSIFFDFLVLDRPVVFFVYDLEDYLVDRGLYFDVEQLPGAVCRGASETSDAIVRAEAEHERCRARYERWRTEYCGAEDGRSAIRVLDAVFKGVLPDAAYRSEDTTRKRILVAGCPFDHSEQTFALIGLSHHLDHEAYDLTVLFTAKLTPQRQRQLHMLHPRTRVRFGQDEWSLTVAEAWMMDAHDAKPAAQRCTPAEFERVRRLYEQERRRLLGETRYDVVLCLTDQLDRWTYLLSVCEFDRRVLWLVESSADRTKRLPASFVLERFDRVVYDPALQHSYFVRDLLALEDRDAAAGNPRVARGTGRFLDFDRSVAGLADWVHAQIDARSFIARGALMHGAAGAHGNLQPCGDVSLGKPQSEAERGILDVTRSMSEWLDAYGQARGIDHHAHNSTVLEEILGALDPGTQNRAPATAQEGERS